MNSLVFRTISLLVLFCVASAANAQRNDGPPTLLIAATDDYQVEPDRLFRPSDGLPGDLAAAIAEELSRDGRFDLVERRAFRRVVEEQNFSQEQESRFTRSVDSAIEELDQLESMQLGSAATFAVVGLGAAQADVLAAMSDRGQAVGARYVLMGSLRQTSTTESASIPGSQRTISRDSTNIRLRLRLIDTENGTLVGASSYNGRLSFSDGSAEWAEPAIYAADFVRDSVYPLALVSRSPIVISRGSSSGVRIGDEVEVMQIGQTIEDNGVVLGRMTEFVGRAIVDSVNENFSTLSASFELEQRADYRITILSTDGLRNDNTSAPENVVALGEIEFSTGADVSPQMQARLAAIRDGIERQFVSLPGVDVADRSRLDAILNELSFQDVLGGNVDYSRISGARYLIVGQFDRLSLREETREISAIGQNETLIIASAEGRFQLLDVVQGLVIDSVLIDYRSSQLAGRTEFESAISQEISTAIASRLFPAEIIGAAGIGRYYINQGADWGLVEGAQFEALSLGDALVDSSGRSFGRAESVTGSLRAVRVEEQRSIVEVVDGAPAVGNRLRRLSTGQTEERAPPSRRPEW